MSSTLKERISDDESEDERSVIRGLEEDQGIHHHPEIDVPPRYDSDEDQPIKGAEPPYKGERPLAEGDEVIEEDDSFSVQNRQMIATLENPFLEDADNMDGLPTGVPAAYPPSSPPAYSSGDEAGERERRQSTGGGTGNGTAGGGMSSTTTALAASAGGMAGMLANVAKPFQSMLKRGSVMEDSEDEEEEEDVYLKKAQSSMSSAPPAGLDADAIQVLSFIEEYDPDSLEIEAPLKPFLLDYIPAVGDIDAFIKIPRPDEVEDNVALTQLDEPAVKQTDPAILDMQLRQVAKQPTNASAAPAKTLDRADRNGAEVEQWINNIRDLHRSKPSASVTYSKNMPDVETLMQEWPAEFERAMQGVKLPTADLDIPLEQYVDVCLGLMDIPVHKSRIESLHLLFSVYNEFRNSQHFRSLAQQRSEKADDMQRLEL